MKRIIYTEIYKEELQRLEDSIREKGYCHKKEENVPYLPRIRTNVKPIDCPC